MTSSLKNKTVRGVVWSSMERFSVQGILFLVMIVMARMLTPGDYGLVGMLTVFIAISQSLVDSGFSQALIRKQNADGNGGLRPKCDAWRRTANRLYLRRLEGRREDVPRGRNDHRHGRYDAHGGVGKAPQHGKPAEDRRRKPRSALERGAGGFRCGRFHAQA